MKLLVWVTKRGEISWAKYTEPHIRAYCERHGYDLVFGDVGFNPARSISWSKLLIHQYLSVPFVLFMDLDMIPLPNAPPIHSVLDMWQLNLVRCPLLATGAGAEAEEKYNLPVRSLIYNCGLMGVPSLWKDFMERAYAKADPRLPWWEQTAINLAIRAENVRVNELSAPWNAAVPEFPRQNQSWRDNFFVHLMGHDDKDRLAAIVDGIIGPAQPSGEDRSGIAGK